MQKFTVEIKELIGTELMTELASTTIRKDLKKELDLKKSFRAKHSLIRSNVYQVIMKNIPSFVATHFVRHKVGVEHFISTWREDRIWIPNEELNRLSPVNHTMIINAEALMNISYKRLCYKASPETLEVMEEIKKKVEEIHPELSECLHRNCIEKGFCPEYKSCNFVDTEEADRQRNLYLK